MNMRPFCSPRHGSRRAARSIAALVAAFSAVATAPICQADLKIVEQKSDAGTLSIYQMTVTPAAEPVPALKERLILRELDLKPGNAAPFYYRAFMAAPSVRNVLHDKFGDEPDKWDPAETPLHDLPQNRVREAINLYEGQIMQSLREATARQECDWSWHVELIRGPDSVSFLIPEMGVSRELGRGLMLRARLAVAEGRYDDALAELRMLYRMGHDVAVEPLLVCSLVGVAESGLANSVVIELEAAQGSPNLYWALAELPDPMIDLRSAFRRELSWAYNIFPFLRDAETTEHSPQEWARILAEGFRFIAAISGGNFSPQANDFAGQVAVTGLSLVTYPRAKERLVAAGEDPASVEQMPVGKVVVLDAARQIRLFGDDAEKWTYIPYEVVRKMRPASPLESTPNIGKAATFSRGFGYLMAALLMPAMENARAAPVRLQWQTGALLTIEALRMHAAQTGKLPARLDEIKVVPVPKNPATGEPYEYRLDGDTAVLELPFSDGFKGVAQRYEIKLAK